MNEDKQELADREKTRARGRSKYFGGWTPPTPEQIAADEAAWEEKQHEDPSRHGIGGNQPPKYDKYAPVTGFPMVLRDIDPVSLDGQTELTSRSQVREFEKEHGVERTGLEYTGSSDQGGKPEWWDEYKENKRERETAAKKGKAKPPKFLASQRRQKERKRDYAR